MILSRISIPNISINSVKLTLRHSAKRGNQAGGISVLTKERLTSVWAWESYPCPCLIALSLFTQLSSRFNIHSSTFFSLTQVSWLMTTGRPSEDKPNMCYFTATEPLIGVSRGRFLSFVTSRPGGLMCIFSSVLQTVATVGLEHIPPESVGGIWFIYTNHSMCSCKIYSFRRSSRAKGVGAPQHKQARPHRAEIQFPCS